MYRPVPATAGNGSVMQRAGPGWSSAALPEGHRPALGHIYQPYRDTSVSPGVPQMTLAFNNSAELSVFLPSLNRETIAGHVRL